MLKRRLIFATVALIGVLLPPVALSRGQILSVMAATPLHSVPLEEPASSVKTPNPEKAPWYFLDAEEMLVYYDPWLAGVILPWLILSLPAACVWLVVATWLMPPTEPTHSIKRRLCWVAIISLVIGAVVAAPWIISLSRERPAFRYFAPYELHSALSASA
jgi:hypothetical protein